MAKDALGARQAHERQARHHHHTAASRAAEARRDSNHHHIVQVAIMPRAARRRFAVDHDGKIHDAPFGRRWGDAFKYAVAQDRRGRRDVAKEAHHWTLSLAP